MFQVRVHPFSITEGLHLPEMFRGKGREMPLEGCPNHAAALGIAQLHLSDGHGSGAAAGQWLYPRVCLQQPSVGNPSSFGG